MNEPGMSTYSEQIDTVFHTQDEHGQSFDIVLIEVTAGKSSPRQEQFSLLFQAPVETAPLQGLYAMEHEAMGHLDLFLVPVKKDEKALYMEAVFNRLRE